MGTGSSPGLDDSAASGPSLRAAANRLLAAADAMERRVERALTSASPVVPGWYRHLIYAPLPSYEPEVLPGVAEAIESGDRARER